MERIVLDRVLAAADELISLVRGIPKLGGHQGDTSGLFMYGAFRQGFRRFVAIRGLADAGAAAEASVLTRSLVNILVRTSWIDEPEDPAERRDRFDRLLRRQYEDKLNELELQQAAGFSVDPAAIAEARRAVDELVTAGVRGVPPDRQLFETLKLGPVHAWIYAPASNQMHFSIDSAIHDLIDVDEVKLEEPDYTRAAEVLTLAIIAFGILLEKSEEAVRHGVTAEAVAIGGQLVNDLNRGVSG